METKQIIIDALGEKINSLKLLGDSQLNQMKEKLIKLVSDNIQLKIADKEYGYDMLYSLPSNFEIKLINKETDEREFHTGITIYFNLDYDWKAVKNNDVERMYIYTPEISTSASSASLRKNPESILNLINAGNFAKLIAEGKFDIFKKYCLEYQKLNQNANDINNEIEKIQDEIEQKKADKKYSEIIKQNLAGKYFVYRNGRNYYTAQLESITKKNFNFVHRIYGKRRWPIEAIKQWLIIKDKIFICETVKEAEKLVKEKREQAA